MPRRPEWPLPLRVECGGGFDASADWARPRSDDIFQSLRRTWSKLVSDFGLAQQLQHILQDGRPTSLFADVQLGVFRHELHRFLAPFLENFTPEWLSRPSPGQPFALNLLEAMAVVCQDKDADFVQELREGASLGLHSPIPPCPLFPPAHQAPLPPEELVDMPLDVCRGAFKERG